MCIFKQLAYAYIEILFAFAFAFVYVCTHTRTHTHTHTHTHKHAHMSSFPRFEIEHIERGSFLAKNEPLLEGGVSFD